MRGITEIPEHPVIRWIEATGYPRELWRGGADIICPCEESEEIDEVYTE